jgi:hypothetical protein
VQAFWREAVPAWARLLETRAQAGAARP